MERFYNTQNHSDKNILWCKELGRGIGCSGGAMVLGELPVAGRPTVWMIVGQRPIALAEGAGGVVWTFYSRLSFLRFLPVSGRRPDVEKYCLKGPLNQKQQQQQWERVCLLEMLISPPLSYRLKKVL